MGRISRSGARKILTRCSRGGVAYVHGRGYRWVMDVFLPCLALLETSKSRRDQELAADGYYRLGDVHDFNHAPQAAIAAYRRCLRLDPQEAAAWREIGMMYEHSGQHHKALAALRRATRMDPDDVYARDDLKASSEYPSPPLRGRARQIQRACELLARRRFQDALSLLRKARSIPELQVTARIYGAQGDCDRVLATWEKISRRKGPVELLWEDWHFLPGEVFDSTAWWTLMWQLRKRWKSCSWPRFPSTDDLNLSTNAKGFRARSTLVVKYYLAKTGNDFAAALELSRRNPRWKAAADLARRLRRISSASRLP